MKKDKAKYIGEQREALKQYIDEQNAGEDTRSSVNAISRSLGVSAAMLSQFMNEKYPGDNFNLAKKIESFLKRQKERIDYREPIDEIVMTKNVKRVLNVLRICHIEGEMGIITGDAGLSKTTGIMKYKNDNPGGVIIIEAIPGTTAKTLMSEIHKAVGFSGEGTQWRLFHEVREKLTGSERLIIIDEAEHLPTSALELNRRIHDMTGVGIVIAGLPRLLSNIRGKKSDYRQLYSRIGIKAELNDLEEDDVKMLVQAAIPSSNGLYKHFYKRTQNGRTLTKMIKRAIQVAQVNDREIDEQVIESARNYIII